MNRISKNKKQKTQAIFQKNKAKELKFAGKKSNKTIVIKIIWYRMNETEQGIQKETQTELSDL